MPSIAGGGRGHLSAGEGGEVRVLAAAEPPDRAPVRCKEAPGPAAGD